MEEKKIEGYTPEEVEAIRKKDRFYTKARRTVGITLLSLMGAALFFTVGGTASAITELILTDKQEALVEELSTSSSEFVEYHTNTINSLRTDLLNNKITDQEYIDGITKLNSIEHKREVLKDKQDKEYEEQIYLKQYYARKERATATYEAAMIIEWSKWF